MAPTTTWDKCPFSDKKCPLLDDEVAMKECPMAMVLEPPMPQKKTCAIRFAVGRIALIADAIVK